MYKYAIIVAGGTGARMKSDTPKQFQVLKGMPVIWHTLKAFTDAYSDVQIILVLPNEYMETGKSLAEEFPEHRIRVTEGGDTRFQSVKNGLQLVDAHSLVFVHDGVRCLVTPELIHRCAASAGENGNAIPTVAINDSVRLQSANGNEPVDRSQLRIIQTPQTFFSDVLKAAFEQAYQPSFTDEASVVEKMGVKINLVEGDNTNIKITRPIDLHIASKLLDERRAAIKTGN